MEEAMRFVHLFHLEGKLTLFNTRLFEVRDPDIRIGSPELGVWRIALIRTIQLP